MANIDAMTSGGKLVKHPREKPAEYSTQPWKAKPVTVELFQSPDGQWWQTISDGNPLPATDACVSLWKELQAAKKVIEKLQRELDRG